MRPQLSDVASFENLRQSAWEVFRGKRNRLGTAALFRDLEGELLRLRSELIQGAYRPGPYRTFWIHEPKPRLISAAPLRDRIVHHALVCVIQGSFERRFIHHSYACRPGKGNLRCLDMFVRWARSRRYVLKLDVRKFFPSIDHAILKECYRRVIRDPKLLTLMDRMVDGSNAQESAHFYFPGDELWTPSNRRRGLPIGNLTSQFFANVFLDPIDHLVKDRWRVRAYLRYVDDLALFHDDQERLRDLHQALREAMHRRRLRLNEKKSRLRQAKEGIEFLGFVVRPDSLRLSQTAVRRQRRRLANLRQAYANGHLEWSAAKASMQSWNVHASHGSTWRLREQVFARNPFVRSELAVDPKTDRADFKGRRQ